MSVNTRTPNPEFDAFTRLVDMVLSVPNAVVKQKIEEHRHETARNPRKRGPKKRVRSQDALDEQLLASRRNEPTVPWDEVKRGR